MTSTPSPDRRAHFTAVLTGLLVTVLWSSSWILIKIGLKANLPALTFAGLRYSLAFLCLLPFVLIDPGQRCLLRRMPRPTWIRLVVLGVIFYALTQGAQFVSLAFLPAATLTLMLNFTPVLIALFSGFGAREPTSLFQWGGILLSSAGALIYFLPLDIPAGQALGLAVALVGLAANAVSALLGRQANTQTGLPPILVTTVSMGVGGLLLLLAGALTQGFGSLDWQQWLIVAWLAVVNTALAFTLWNRSLKILTAVESGVINGLMLPQIAILAWIFLGETLGPRQVVGIAVVALGTLVVQLWRYLPGVRKSASAAGK